MAGNGGSVEQETPASANERVALSQRVVELRPPTSRTTLGLGELWRSRELVFWLALRDIQVRYKQTALGIAWVLLQPLVTMGVFSIVFGRLAKLPSDGVPYPLFVLAGLVPWTFFASALTNSAQSLVLNVNLLTKVYFPRLAIPIAAALASLVDLALATLLLVVATCVWGPSPTARLLALVPLMALCLAAVLGVGLWLAATNVRYRDVRYVVPFLVQLWLFATPVAYSSSLVPSRWRPLYALNPMVGVIDGYRWAVLGVRLQGPTVAVSLCSVAALLLFGVWTFRRQERSFADMV